MKDFSKYFQDMAESVTIKDVLFSMSACRQDDFAMITVDDRIFPEAGDAVVGDGACAVAEYARWCVHMIKRPYASFQFYRKNISGVVLGVGVLLNEKAVIKNSVANVGYVNVRRMTQGNWQILLAEQKMELGEVDNLLFGKDACHSFLVLVNPQGDVVSELHGTTFSPRLQRLAYGGGSLPSYLRTGAQMVGAGRLLERFVQTARLDSYFARLKVAITSGEWRVEQSVRDRTVLRGDVGDIVPRWVDACRMGDMVNAQDLFYVPVCLRSSGQNCNSVTSLMLDVVGARVAKHEFHLAAHGYNHPFADLRALLPKWDRTVWQGNHDVLLSSYIGNPNGMYSRYAQRVGTP